MSKADTTSRPLPRPLHLVLSSTGAAGSLTPAPHSARADGPLSAPLRLNGKEVNDNGMNSKPSPRRQSSISYNTGSSQTRSPGLGRSNSLGSKVVLAREVPRSDGSGPSNILSHPEARETEPVTLAEKHADLLRFIAQKESKCLELRTQLAQHEADLLLLKRKWERIVSKGLPSSARSDVSAHVGSEMLDGIREGVQSGLGRVLAALEPSPAGPSSTSQLPLSTPQSKSWRDSQSNTKEASTSYSKRVSISTASSGSTWDRSSLSGSRSSASSLFDDFSSPDRRSSTSSIEGESTASPSPAIGDTFVAAHSQHPAGRDPSPLTPSAAGQYIEKSIPEGDPSSKKPRSRPVSTNFSQFSSPFSASVASETLIPLSKQMANWVPPGFNRKWEELKGNETLSKQSKRASTLLNDVLAVIAPPIPPSSKTNPSTIPKRNSRQLQPPSHHNLDSSFFDYTTLEASSVQVSPSLSPSLLDEEDECKLGEVLQPQVKVPGVLKGEVQNKKEEDKEEVWNW